MFHHGEPSWGRARRQLIRRAAVAKPYAHTARERDLISMIERNADAILARPSVFLEASAMLHAMMNEEGGQR